VLSAQGRVVAGAQFGRVGVAVVDDELDVLGRDRDGSRSTAGTSAELIGSTTLASVSGFSPPARATASSAAASASCLMAL
jgi:hypothetical protein